MNFLVVAVDDNVDNIQFFICSIKLVLIIVRKTTTVVDHFAYLSWKMLAKHPCTTKLFLGISSKG